MNFKKIAAAALAVASMGAAHADIGSASSYGTVETFVTIWNNKASLIIDLGQDSTLLSTSFSSAMSYDLAALAGSSWASFFNAAAGGSTIAWSVQSTDTDANTLWTTAKVGQESKAGTTTGGNRLNGQLDTDIANMSFFIGNLSTADFNTANNNVTLPPTTTTADYWSRDGLSPSWGFTSAGNVIGATASLFNFTDSFGDGSEPSKKYVFAQGPNTVSLSSAGVLTFQAAAVTPSVPEPETYGLALVGLVLAGLVARRRA